MWAVAYPAAFNISATVTSSAGGVGIYFPEHSWAFDGSVAWRTEPG